MRYLTSILLYVGLLIGEVHTLFENCSYKVNFVLIQDVSMPVQWAAKYITDELWFVIAFAALVVYRDNKINRTTCIVALIYSIADMVLFFVNYKQQYYESVYLILLISWILIYNYGFRTTNRKRIIATT